MKHPSELFVKHLITLGFSDDDIKKTLKDFGLPPILDAYSTYLLDLRADLEFGKPKCFTIADTSSDSIDYLKKHKIYNLLHPDATILSCTQIFDSPQARRDVYMGILGRVEEFALVSHINKKFSLDISVRTLQVIKHYYFSSDSISSEDWAELFSNMPGGTDATGFESCLSGGASVASYRIGIEQNITIREVVKEAVTALYVSLQEIKHWPASSSKIKVLSDTVSALAKAHVVMNTADQELASVAAELKQFKLSRNTTKPVSLESLTKQGKINA
jgi:hypothetical protein